MKHKDKFALINKFLPNLKIKESKIIESGSHSLAIIVNNDLVFRFPLKKEFNDEYITEKIILDEIRSFISTKIPNLTIYEDKDQIFTLHKIIKGEQYSNLKNINKDKVAEGVAKFLAELHSIKTDKIKTEEFSLEDYQIEGNNIEIINKYLKDKNKIEEFNKTIEAFKKESKNLRIEDQVICHDDVNENNILINERGELEGIIDFGNSIKRNYNVDFTALLKWDYELITKIIKKYEEITKRKVNLKYAILVQKIKCYGGIIYCLNENDEKNIKMFEEWLDYIKNNYKSIN